jgi:hypothetical protein
VKRTIIYIIFIFLALPAYGMDRPSVSMGKNFLINVNHLPPELISYIQDMVAASHYNYIIKSGSIIAYMISLSNRLDRTLYQEQECGVQELRPFQEKALVSCHGRNCTIEGKITAQAVNIKNPQCTNIIFAVTKFGKTHILHLLERDKVKDTIFHGRYLIDTSIKCIAWLTSSTLLALTQEGKLYSVVLEKDHKWNLPSRWSKQKIPDYKVIDCAVDQYTPYHVVLLVKNEKTNEQCVCITDLRMYQKNPDRYFLTTLIPPTDNRMCYTDHYLPVHRIEYEKGNLSLRQRGMSLRNSISTTTYKIDFYGERYSLLRTVNARANE